ncbi:MAG: hypothetical protein ACI4ED_01065 [Suilimivivens sp.]
MQIRNDYTSFQNKNYQESHTHHITECLNEDQVKKREGALGAGQSTLDMLNTAAEFSKDGDIYQMSAGRLNPERTGKKSGTNLLKGFWDALGEEGTESNKNVMAVWKDNLLSGIHGAATSIREALQYQVVERIQNIPVRVKAVLQSAGTRFGRGKDAFTALTDGQSPSGEERSGTGKRNREGQVTSTGKEDDIPMRVLKHSHLMDSYSRQGEYCQLNDNLTYRNTRNGRKTQKEE